MRRMLRFLKWLGLGASTILFATMVVLWLRSMGQYEGWKFWRFEPNPAGNTGPVARQGADRVWVVNAIDGRLWLEWWTTTPASTQRSGAQYRREILSADQGKQMFEEWFQPARQPNYLGIKRAWHFAGMGVHHRQGTVNPLRTGRLEFEGFLLALPFWMLTALFALWPLSFTARRLLRRQRHPPGLCPHCGYDLRATPNRCPECGRAVEAPCR